MWVTVLTQIAIYVALGCFILAGWDILVSFAGFLPERPLPEAEYVRRFVVLVPAHNESRVISVNVESLLRQEYSRERFRVLVIADNCTDDTEELAVAAGAECWARNAANSTKGHAVQWAIDRLIAEDHPLDAFAVVDADNLVEPTFLHVTNAALDTGSVAVQVYLDVKNPTDTWITRAIAACYWLTNFAWFRARARLGLNITLGGTGIAFDWDRVGRRHRWDTGCLTEDLELTQSLLVEDGEKVRYTGATRVYDEKPTTWSVATRQRTRWMQGHHDVAWRWFGRTIARAVSRNTLTYLDTAMYLLVPLRWLLATLALTWFVAYYTVAPIEMWGSKATLAWMPYGLLGFVALAALYPIAVLIAARRSTREASYLIFSLIFAWCWLPATIVGIARFRNRSWTHTPHGRG